MASGHDPELQFSAADAAAAYSLPADVEFEVVGRLAGGEKVLPKSGQRTAQDVF